MHVYFFLRGMKPFVEETKAFLSSQFWKMKVEDKETGEKRDVLVQGGLRESVLGVQEYILPETALPEFLAMTKTNRNNRIGINKKKNLHKFKLSVVRNVLGASRIPRDVWNKAEKIQTDVIVDGFERGLSAMPKRNVGFHLIGIQKDGYGSPKRSTHKHELL